MPNHKRAAGGDVRSLRDALHARVCVRTIKVVQLHISNEEKRAIIMANNEKPRSTVDRWMEKPGFKETFKKEYKEFLLSELVLALMAEDSKSVRALARELGVSKTVIQNLRSGQQADMKLSNFVKLTRAYGYDLVLEKAGERIRL